MFDNLRQEAKTTKALDGVSFKEMAEAIEVKQIEIDQQTKNQIIKAIQKLLKDVIRGV